jgi:hypothetical protein
MSGFSATDLGIVSPRLAALKRRGRALNAPTTAPASNAPASIAARDVARLTRYVANGDVDGVCEPPAVPVARRRDVAKTAAAAGTRSHERRWRSASIILVERRRGRLYQYGSIAICAALWAQVLWMFRA